jgi:plastocyanin
MDISLTTPRAFSRKPLAALGKLTVYALLALAAVLVHLEVTVFELDPRALPFIAAPLLLAGVAATGWRAAPLLGALWCGLFTVMAIPFTSFNLAHPEQLQVFAEELWLDLALIGGIVGGIAATVQNYRTPLAERRTPAWLPYALTAMAALTAGALLVAAVVQGRDSTGVSPETLAQLPALSVKAAKFEQPELHARVGQTVALRLENADGQGHSFDVDELNVHADMPSGKAGLALFTPSTPGTYTFYCALHYDKQTGQGMKGTLIVAP